MKFSHGFIVLCICTFLPAVAFAQTKFEREYRIKEKDVPEQALRFINNAVEGGKVKWYAEESQDGNNIEAKLKYQKQKFSVEFDTLGNLQDVEKTVKLKNLNQKTSDAISRSLATKFGDYKIRKVQIQWTANDYETLTELIRNRNSTGTYDEKFEIVIETRKNKAYKAFEVLIDRNGKIEKSLELDLRSMNNIEF